MGQEAGCWEQRMPGGGGKKESELDRPALNHPALTQSCFFGGTTSPSAPPSPPNIAPDLEKLDKTKTNSQNLDLWLKSKEISLS